MTKVGNAVLHDTVSLGLLAFLHNLATTVLLFCKLVVVLSGRAVISLGEAHAEVGNAHTLHIAANRLALVFGKLIG